MSKFVLKFLWLEKAIAVSLDQKVAEKTSPVTEYFFWPRKDAWEEMKLDLETKPWITKSDSISLLNQVTEVINFWQENNGLDLVKVRARFPECIFIGYS